jgi:hypothetical protein
VKTDSPIIGVGYAKQPTKSDSEPGITNSASFIMQVELSFLYFVLFPADGIVSHLSERMWCSKVNAKKVLSLPILYVRTLSFQTDVQP